MPSATVFSWTEPVAGVTGHPRLGFTGADIPTLQSSKSGSQSASWSALASWCVGKRSQAYTYFTAYDAEYLGAFAFLYAVDNSYTTDADKAISWAISIAGLAIPSDIYYVRRYALQMAMVYDWAYDRLNDSQRVTLRNRIWDYCNGPLYINGSNAEYLWGHSHGNICIAAVALTAILGEGDTTQNTTWRNKMNEYLNHWDNGTNTCYLAGFRYFSYGEGGTHKGSASLHVVDRRLEGSRERLGRLGAQLDALSPLRVLGRGYAVARDEAGRVLRRREDFPEGLGFRLRVTDGDVPARVEGT